MYLSLRLGISLEETLKLSFKEFLLWQDYFKEEWNTPDRTDHYLMQVALKIIETNTKNSKTKLNDLKIPFKEAKKKPGKFVHTKQSIEATKSRWRAAAGYDPINLPQEESQEQ